MPDERQRWLEAGKILAVDPAAKVECPSCGAANLIVTDAEAGDERRRILERWLQCPVCLAWNTLLTQAAAGHSQDMATRNYFSHTSPDGVTMVDRINAVK